jgi:hypothetical protein
VWVEDITSEFFHFAITGKLVVTNQHKIKFDDLIALLLLDHEINGRTETVKFHVRHLRRFFGFDRATAITNERLLRYVKSRRDEGAADGSIKLELAALSKAFNLAIQARKLYPERETWFPENRAGQCAEALFGLSGVFETAGRATGRFARSC